MGLGVSGVSLVVMFVALEVIFRSFFPQPLYATALAPWGAWHQPNVSFLHASDPHNEGRLLAGTEYLTHISYDSLGIRGPEYAIPKPAGVKRVVIVGDSFGDAMEVEFPQTMGQVLGRMLEDRRAALTVTPPPVSQRPATSDIASQLWVRLRSDAAASGAPLLVSSLRITADGKTPRAAFFDGLGIPWASVDLPAADRFTHDGHWNVQGNADAAQRVFEKIASAGLLRLGSSDRVEVINLSAAAYVTCQYVQIFEALGRQFDPDLVIAVDSGTDANAGTGELCSQSANGDLVLRSHSYGTFDRLVRNARSFARANSHFLTWVFSLIDRLPAATGPDRVPEPTP